MLNEASPEPSGPSSRRTDISHSSVYLLQQESQQLKEKKKVPSPDSARAVVKGQEESNFP
jgi:hypothetical protein